MRTRRSRARISLAVMAVFAIVAVFAVRLIDIQLVQADELNAESLDKRAQSLTLYGVRGNIVDANGEVLAQSVERYDITASPRSALGRTELNGSVAQSLADIAAITGQKPDELMAALTADPESDFAYLAKGVTLDVFHAVRDLDIPWVYFELRPARTYPNGAIAGNLVGYLGTNGATGEGSGGLEYSENECLASSDGEATFERGEDGVQLPGSVVTVEEPKDGGTLHLTIDRDLQYYVQQRMVQTFNDLGALWTIGVVMRVSDGALMAVADYPSLDPNDVDNAPRNADGELILGSRAFTLPYEPGSIMKPLTAASLLDSGAATVASQVVAPYRLYLSDGGNIKDAVPHPDERLTLAGAIVESSNTAVSQFSDLLDAQSRHDYMIDFGLGDYTEAGFLGEAAGTVHPADEWDVRTNYTVQFGQGMTATAIQMASVFQTLGNDGLRVPVKLTTGCERPDGTMTDVPGGESRQVVSASAAEQTVNMMEMVAQHSYSADDLTIPGYRVAAKSGTAEVAENGVYGNQSVISYVGLAPADDPQYVVLVSAGLPRMDISGKIAPTFRDVMAHVLTTYRVPPSTTPANQLPLTW
ncbi:penicillin-binding protein 2 [Leifsonia sp. H3M29-4]|uniref:peptidoglycan D,D-transpeptidase FtsI family protein n=1 Tax=Salinibacterium metalliresistens TaxID=3031321 RepID=UPI0023DBA73C|nr:penicillin-binding protein 2 [Salinibacterium metalliresistens]MDF1480155.1 penicillin-binding protein 2 [Salinibacterium metalliresistens]